MLTINEELTNKGDLLEIIWGAYDYFPEGFWKDVNYVGNISVKHDLEIKSKEEVYGAFIFPYLVRKIREARNMLRIRNLLLGVTHDPVIVTYHRFESDRFRMVVDVVHDYVSNDVGMISLFETEDEVGIKVAAHGLGHYQDLRHHAKPIDLMYARLLNGCPITVDGFCSECQQRLRRKLETEKEKSGSNA